jgi:phosphohistidine swiveling domain-containing protein
MPLYITIYPPLYTVGFKERFGQEAEIIYAAEGRKAHWYMRGDQLDALAEKNLPQLFEGGWEWYEQCKMELAEFGVFNKMFLAAKLESLSEDELRAWMTRYRENFAPPFITNNLLEAYSYYFQHSLKSLLTAEGLDASRIDELMEQYGQSAAPNYVKECAEAYRRAATEDEKESVRKKYYFIFNDYGGPNETTHEELRKLAESTPYEYAQKFKTVGIPSRAQSLLTALQVVATVQDVRKAELLEMVTAANRFGRESARRAGVSMEDMEYATWEEVEEGKWKIEDLRARRQPFVMYWTLDGVRIYQSEEATALITLTYQHILKVEDGAKEVKGICASKGKTVGRAVVVFETKEFDRVRDGDILFTVMTRPEFLPVMYKAAAFVCDEGGLTSHAAIVAREMKKPCVIATRVGTRTFKDGDMVEVDANAGVVRKISPAK